MSCGNDADSRATLTAAERCGLLIWTISYVLLETKSNSWKNTSYNVDYGKNRFYFSISYLNKRSKTGSDLGVQKLAKDPGILHAVENA